MSTGAQLETPPAKEQDSILLPSNFFSDLLRAAQNADGGWGYHSGSTSCAEPTAWAVLALRSEEPPDGGALASASAWLRRAQLTEGPWPTCNSKDPGCWATALACLALLKLSAPSDGAVLRGLKWLCEMWPAEGNLLWRLSLHWRQRHEQIIRQDFSLRGWSWTPQTASWVEPTAYVLILLRNIPKGLHPPKADQRIDLAERMLYDRACPGGGWNTGNPLVYGVPGVPRIGPTVWALLALENHQGHEKNIEGIQWLERSYPSICSPASLALANLCLRVYGRNVPSAEPNLRNLYERNQFLKSVPALAWALLAAGDIPDWLRSRSQARGGA